MYKVPYGLDVSVGMCRVGDTVYVDVYAPMYIRKYWRLAVCYSTYFSDGQILRDSTFVTKMLEHFPP